MRLLLDTHALAWWVRDDVHLSSNARDLIADAANEVWVSAVTAFEMALTHRLGKWDEIGVFVDVFEQAVADERFELLPVTTAHALHGARFASAHRDPFDRLLAGQAAVEELVLVTGDRAFDEFGIRTIW